VLRWYASAYLKDIRTEKPSRLGQVARVVDLLEIIGLAAAQVSNNMT